MLQTCLHLHLVRVFYIKYIKFTDDTFLYKKCKVKDIPHCANIIKNDVEHLKAWSDVNSLVFNETNFFNKTDQSITSSRRRRYLFSRIKWK